MKNIERISDHEYLIELIERIQSNERNINSYKDSQLTFHQIDAPHLVAKYQLKIDLKRVMNKLLKEHYNSYLQTIKCFNI